MKLPHNVEIMQQISDYVYMQNSLKDMVGELFHRANAFMVSIQMLIPTTSSRSIQNIRGPTLKLQRLKGATLQSQLYES